MAFFTRFANWLGAGNGMGIGGAIAPSGGRAIVPVSRQLPTIQSVPVVPAPRYFSPVEAGMLKQFAAIRAEQAGATCQAYKALGGIAKADARVHAAHYDYRTNLAKATFTKHSANVAHTSEINDLGVQYGMLNAQAQLASQLANREQSRLQYWVGRIQAIV